MWDNTGYTCEACGFPTVQPHDFVDRHGDIEQLCAGCYCDALRYAKPTTPIVIPRLMAWLCAFGIVGFAVWTLL